MKTLFITSIVAITLTSNAIAKDWGWFHGDIGMASPFSFNSPQNNVTKQAVAKSKATSRQSVVARKSKSGRTRLTAR